SFIIPQIACALCWRSASFALSLGAVSYFCAKSLVIERNCCCCAGISAAETIFGSSAPSCIVAAFSAGLAAESAVSSAGLAAESAASPAGSVAGGTAFSAGFIAENRMIQLGCVMASRSVGLRSVMQSPFPRKNLPLKTIVCPGLNWMAASCTAVLGVLGLIRYFLSKLPIVDLLSNETASTPLP